MRSINIQELEVLFNRVLKKLDFELVGTKEIIIERDFYGFIPTDKRQDLYTPHPEILTGSLYDDLDELKKLVNSDERPCTYVDFDRLANVLMEISQIQNPPFDNSASFK